MSDTKRKHPEEKSSLHPRNKHRKRYNFPELIATCPELAAFVHENKYGDESVDFFDPKAVKMLNKALLKHHYGVENWDIPPGYLCPPIPGRADYLHHIADLLASGNAGNIPTGTDIVCMDIGVGANCVYPIIASQEYGWSCIGTDIDAVAIQSAHRILESNPVLSAHITLRMQPSPADMFRGMIHEGERIDLTICNPPFHASFEEAQAATRRKIRNLKGKKINKPIQNFGGKQGELWCKGGEVRFVRDMIYQSRHFATSCHWFSTLISKESHLKGVYSTLQKVKAIRVETLPMGQGNKISRIVAWTFLKPEQQKAWAADRW